MNADNSTIVDELRSAGDRALAVTQAQKKNYAEALSRKLAIRFANGLRSSFPEILPSEFGVGQESKARTAKGFKRLDVNYSKPEIGLGLGISIKTINFRDAKTIRYTKNYTRVDGELRAEASDYHERQPYAVMIAVVFIPLDACGDGRRNMPSSFGQAVQIFRYRSGRSDPSDSSMLFERVFIGLYDTADESFGDVRFFDVMNAPPKQGRPELTLSFSELFKAIVSTYDTRNRPTFVWADAAPEPLSLPESESDGDDGESV